MNNKSIDLDTTASIHAHHAPQLELQAVGGAIRLRLRSTESSSGLHLYTTVRGSLDALVTEETD